ncbi:MAG: transglycosylase family protein, partial [Actinomycetota bacterium]|nr:transglycosylase family protein [Actinomycetota bacterium]
MTLIDFVVPAPPVAVPPPPTPAVVAALVVPAPVPPATVAAPHQPQPPAAALADTTGSPGGVWACIRRRESGGNYATNTGNGYYGAYQFSESTWQSIGGTGYPNQASPAVQDAMAQRLQQRSGWGQWSTHSG